MTEPRIPEAPAPLWSYRPGSWYAALGSEVAVLLPAQQKGYVAALWSLVDGGAAFDEVLDALLASGLSGLPAFAIVSTGPGPTRLLLRGAGISATATAAAGEFAMDGSAAGTWVERSVDGVTALVIRVDDSGEVDGPELAIPAGLVRVAAIRRGATAEATTAEPDLAAEPAAGAESDAEPVTEVIEAPPFDVPPPPVPLEASPLDHDGWTEPTFAGDPLPDPLLDPFPDPAAEAAGPGFPPPPPASIAAPLEPPPLPVGAWEPATPAAPGAVARLHVSDGQSVVVDGVVLIGRSPEARRFTATEQPRLITVPSRLHEISSTHIEVRPGTGADHGTAVVTDMGSTNGTVLVQPGLAPEDLKPGIAVQLIPGAVINIGDGISIQVTRP